MKVVPNHKNYIYARIILHMHYMGLGAQSMYNSFNYGLEFLNPRPNNNVVQVESLIEVIFCPFKERYEDSYVGLHYRWFTSG